MTEHSRHRAAATIAPRSKRRPQWRGVAVARRRSKKFGRSRFVWLMKVVLPMVAVFLLALVTAWPQFRPDESAFRIELAAVGPEGGAKPQVLNARLLGIDGEQRPFQITADQGSTAKGTTGERVYILDQPKADMTLEDGSWIAMTADNGLFEQDSQTLFLSGQVNLFHDSGYEFTTETATVDIERRTAEGYEPVSGQGPLGLLQSEGFRIRDKGETIVFTGRYSMTIDVSAAQ